MERLEGIVEQMESGKLPLEDLIVRYEEGMNLVKICQERLANAEQKIEIIARDRAGKTTVKDFEPTPEPAASAGPSPASCWRTTTKSRCSNAIPTTSTSTPSRPHIGASGTPVS